MPYYAMVVLSLSLTLPCPQCFIIHPLTPVHSLWIPSLLPESSGKLASHLRCTSAIPSLRLCDASARIRYPYLSRPETHFYQSPMIASTVLRVNVPYIADLYAGRLSIPVLFSTRSRDQYPYQPMVSSRLTLCTRFSILASPS
ncbi:hypothetical protein F4775DRAFT_458876 [Biscogniauxia sp. FL1348]|nr:hypothetical protein F4775DRAFT_458876 [Biscogniauxia sp. FL1348]